MNVLCSENHDGKSDSNWTEWSTVRGLILSITEFSIVIGSPLVYLSRNRRAITCGPITGVFVIGYHVIFTSITRAINGFLRNVSFSFQNLGKALQTFSLKKSSHKTILIPKFVIDTIN